MKTGIIVSIRRYMLTGVITLVPLLATWFIFDLLLGGLQQVGQPVIKSMAVGIRPFSPVVAEWLLDTWFQPVMAILIVLIGLYILGFIATLVVGRQMLDWLDMMMQRIPLVQSIYGAVKKLMNALQTKPDGVQRVVLIEFPTSEMKTVGLVTCTFNDTDTGRPLAAVYVPTTPNPTSGYLEIVPQEKLTSTDWTVDEAMTFIMSGGVVAPDRINFDHSSSNPPPEQKAKMPPEIFDPKG